MAANEVNGAMALDAGLARTDQGSAAENEGPEVASGAVPDVMTMTNGMRIAANIGTQTAAENVITTATGIDTMAGIVMAAMKNTTVTVTATIGNGRNAATIERK